MCVTVFTQIILIGENRDLVSTKLTKVGELPNLKSSKIWEYSRNSELSKGKLGFV